MGLTILCAARLHDHQLERHLEPLNDLETVDRILLVRTTSIGTRLRKVRHLGFSDRGTVFNTVQFFKKVDDTLSRERVDCVIGINPLPWGSLAWAAATRRRVPVVLSLIGTDYRRLMHPLAKPLWAPLRSARVVTVPGDRMRKGVIEHGVDRDRVVALPHAIDIRRFRPSDTPPDYDIVFVGQLIEVKRVDVLIDAIAQMRERPRVAVVGQGPLQRQLAARIASRGLTHHIDLLGFRADIERVLQRGRIFVLPSQSEGLPFAMIEAMASGLVPVVTDVGAIGEIVRDGYNGRLVPVGDAQALARTLTELLHSSGMYGDLRRHALQIREMMSLTHATDVWRDIFERHL